LLFPPFLVPHGTPLPGPGGRRKIKKTLKLTPTPLLLGPESKFFCRRSPVGRRCCKKINPRNNNPERCRKPKPSPKFFIFFLCFFFYSFSFFPLFTRPPAFLPLFFFPPPPPPFPVPNFPNKPTEKGRIAFSKTPPSPPPSLGFAGFVNGTFFATAFPTAPARPFLIGGPVPSPPRDCEKTGVLWPPPAKSFLTKLPSE